ncbi:MAG TPA: MinD/ParA family protein [Actinomycetota bacterium]|jgi:septum site-determining protein MinD|nr:MinD/ParA family protein [Actinomycetota bacterium]
MSRIVAIHSFRGGTGKSNTAANVASLLAADGRRVGVVDLDILSPGIHVLFGLDQSGMGHTLNTYLWGKCELTEAAHDVTPAQLNGGGRIWLVPSSVQPHDIARVIHDGYDVAMLNDGFRALIKDLALDVLILDTHPGLNEETLLSLALSHTLAIVLRPDHQDYEGTQVTVTIARKLKVPNILLVVNKTPEVFDSDEVRERVATTYDCPVAAVLPHSDDLMVLSSSGIFSLRYPAHPMTERYRQIAAALMR